MIRPSMGLRCFHQGHAVELLALSRTSDEGEIWIVRPIGVTGPIVRTELFRESDELLPVRAK